MRLWSFTLAASRHFISQHCWRNINLTPLRPHLSSILPLAVLSFFRTQSCQIPSRLQCGTRVAPSAFYSSGSQAVVLNKKNWSKRSTSKVLLTNEQKQVLDAVCNRKSVFITGSAGTGKTFLLEQIIKKLNKIHGRSGVYVTASTGIAACALEGQTLHSFAGVGLGKLDREGLLERVILNRRACKRWRKVKALIIDEISMVDAELFDSLAYIARRVREQFKGVRDDRIWGGIQMIVSGDFFQLPPVIKKKGKKVFAFEADCWSTSFDLQIELTTVFRQSDSVLVRLLQDIRKGDKNPDKLKLLEQCCSEHEPNPSAVRLYPMLDDVDKVNIGKMEELNEEIYVYKAEDRGEEQWIRQLQSGIASDELKLCVGARVMLIKNINPLIKLVNGATGTIVGLSRYSGKDNRICEMCSHGNVLPVVRFDSGVQLTVEPATWSIMEGKIVVASRMQIPLILSWALSIHKCQGMSLEKLHTDLSRVFECGMIYVALSRVRSLGGLHLSGFDPSKIKAHPKVLDFYRGFTCKQHKN